MRAMQLALGQPKVAECLASCVGTWLVDLHPLSLVNSFLFGHHLTVQLRFRHLHSE